MGRPSELPWPPAMKAVLSFVFKRRIGRLSFAIAAVVLLVVKVFTLGPLDFEPGQPSDVVVGPALLLAVIYRLHDLGWSGWWALAVFLVDPVMSMFLPTLWPPPFPFFEFLVIAAVFSLWRGQPHDNEWGSVPWPRKRPTPSTPAS